MVQVGVHIAWRINRGRVHSTVEPTGSVGHSGRVGSDGHTGGGQGGGGAGRTSAGVGVVPDSHRGGCVDGTTLFIGGDAGVVQVGLERVHQCASTGSRGVIEPATFSINKY